MSLHSRGVGGLAQTVIWTLVDDGVDWDQKSLGRERARGGQVGGL